MRIKNLEIVNFRSYPRHHFKLTDRTYFVGHNNSGKTSAIDALGWCLIGKCRGLDGANREIIELIRDGEVEALGSGGAATGLGVKVEIENFGLVTRQTNGREVFLKVKDWGGSNKEQQTTMLERLRVTEAVIAACLDSDAFLRLHHADAKNLIMGVLDVRIPAEQLQPFDIAGPLSLDELERHYKRAFERRTDAKRDLETHVVYPAPAQLEEGEEPPPVVELQDAIEELRDSERDLVGSTSEARGKRQALGEQLAALEKERKTLSDRIKGYGDPNADLDDLEERLRALKDPPAPPAGTYVAGANGALFGEPSDQEKMADATRARLVDARGRLKIVTAAIEGIDQHDPEKGCVIDPSVPCLTPAKEFKGKLAALRKEVKRIGALIEEDDRVLAATLATIKSKMEAEDQAARERAKVAEEHRAAEKRVRDARERLQREASALRAKADHLQADQTRFEEVMVQANKIEDQVRNLGDVAEPEGLAELRARIERAEAMIERVRAWHQANDQHRKSADEHAKLTKKVEQLELLVEKLGPKGFIVDAIEAAKKSFEDKVNAALEKWGYRLAFVIDPWTVRVNGRKSTQLSVSERLRVGVALQLAIAEITGLWFVAIDAVDTLDSANRAVLADVLDGWAGQAVLAATKDPDFEFEPEDLPEGVSMYKLELRDGLTHVAAAGVVAAT